MSSQISRNTRRLALLHTKQPSCLRPFIYHAGYFYCLLVSMGVGDSTNTGLSVEVIVAIVALFVALPSAILVVYQFYRQLRTGEGTEVSEAATVTAPPPATPPIDYARPVEAEPAELEDTSHAYRPSEAEFVPLNWLSHLQQRSGAPSHVSAQLSRAPRGSEDMV
ncbi:hypothetical protein M0657_010925 [Pyricularia oryzae]|nr:hypothetical protein MCOR04_007662 [Pyricularia oryzae]KAI7911507.1 hypothetical protein M0657_010925 [Pyricularia oryzae]KAI7914449.1 hypothetical protein M9X92_008984 [Pyricularia oryzae]